MIRKLALAVVMLGTLAACGGEQTGVVGPDDPSPTGWPAGTHLEILGGDTGDSVAATVMVYQNGAMVPYTGQAVEAGSNVEITAPGYLKRETMVRTGQTRLVLWPNSANLPASYTKELVYTVDGKTYPLYRPVASSASVIPSGTIRSDAAAIDAHRQAMASLNDALAGTLAFGFDTGSSVEISTVVDATLPACTQGYAGSTTTNYAGARIISARITFCSERWSRNVFVITHELGHVAGLHHSSDRGDVMNQGSGRTSFSPRERLTIFLMFQRNPGNTFPDNDRQTAAASGRGSLTFVD